MADHSKRIPGSSFSGRSPTDKPLVPSKMSEAEIRPALEAALLAGDGTRALEVLDSAPRWMARQPEIILVRASVLLSLGYDQEALQHMLEIVRKKPQFTAVYLPLAMLYMDREWPAHALQAAKRAQADRDLNDEGRDSLVQIIEEATALIQAHAGELGIPFETMLRASLFHEQAQMALDEDKFSEADRFCREAIKIAPSWNSPHNNRAHALFYSGKVEEAISVSEVVLAREAENVFALSGLVTYHLGVNQPERAHDYASRLGQLFKKIPADGMEIEMVISTLALVEDTPTLWKIAKSMLDAPSDSLYGRSWFCLAVAAIRSGKWKDALKLMEKADEEDLPPAGKTLLEELRTVVVQRHPCLAWMPPAYPGADLFFHPKVLAEWDVLMQKLSDPVSPSQKRRMDNFFKKYPFMVAALKRLLWDGESNQMALQALLDMDRPDADDEVLRFALSQTGSREARLQSFMKLGQTERYTGARNVDIWDEDLEEWREIELNNQRIGEVEPNARPETMALIEKAQNAKDPAEAISLLQKAVEKESTCPTALFNLGVMLVQSGRVEEGEKLLYRSVDVDPNYDYGHASIALSAASQGHEQEALDHLEFVTKANVITPDTAVVASLAWMLLSLDKDDLKGARQQLETAIQINPNHRLIGHYKDVLKDAEDYYEKYHFLLEYQRESNQRAHQKLLRTPLSENMDLHACLETNTKDMLVGSARFLRTSSSGKKGVLATWLAGVLLDEGFLKETLYEDLAEKDREALRWMLESDGVRPWKEFTRKYGDETRDSTVWNYHEPTSIPGRLRMSGLFYSGALEGQTVAFIPGDLRSLLRKLLK